MLTLAAFALLLAAMPESARKTLASAPAAPHLASAHTTGATFAARWPEKPLPMLSTVTGQIAAAAHVPQPAAAAAEKPVKKSAAPRPHVAAKPPQASFTLASTHPATDSVNDQAQAYLSSGSELAGGVVSSGPDWNGILTARSAEPQSKPQEFQLAHNLPRSEPFQASVLNNRPMPETKTELIKFATAPFPYEGTIPTTGQPFLNVTDGDQKGHRTWRGNVLWEEKTFSDSRVLVHIPRGFDINKPAVMIVFFHGHGAKLNRDVLLRQKLPEQISLSGVNAVLVAPQFAVDAADSSPGRFWQQGAFNRFLNEAGTKLADLYGQPSKAPQFANMPVVLVAYSGGYLPAATVIRHGGIGKRLRGVVLLDALYGEIPTFVQWIKRSPHTFFVSSYTTSTQRHNDELKHLLAEADIPYSNGLDHHLWSGGVTFLPATSRAHRDFVTNAWTSLPIKDVLAKLN